MRRRSSASLALCSDRRTRCSHCRPRAKSRHVARRLRRSHAESPSPAHHICPSRVPVTCARLAPPSASHVCPSCASDYNEPARPQRYSTIEHHGGARQRYATATKVALRDQGSTSPQMPLSCTFGPNVAPLSGAGPRSARRSLITRFDHEV